MPRSYDDPLAALLVRGYAGGGAVSKTARALGRSVWHGGSYKKGDTITQPLFTSPSRELAESYVEPARVPGSKLQELHPDVRRPAPAKLVRAAARRHVPQNEVQGYTPASAFDVNLHDPREVQALIEELRTRGYDSASAPDIPVGGGPAADALVLFPGSKAYAGGGRVAKAMKGAIELAAEKAGMKAPTLATKDLTTLQDFRTSFLDRVDQRANEMQELMESMPFKYDKGQRVFTEDSVKKNKPPYTILRRTLVGNQPMRGDHPQFGPGLGKPIKDPVTGKTVRTPYEQGYRVRHETDPENWSEFDIPESAIKGDVEMAGGGLVAKAAKEIAEHRMRQGFYRGYAGDQDASKMQKVYVSPQRRVGERYAQRRAEQTGEEPHLEMVLADPFAGRAYGHAPATRADQPTLSTIARQLAPEDVRGVTKLYAAGGRVLDDQTQPDIGDAGQIVADVRPFADGGAVQGSEMRPAPQNALLGAIARALRTREEVQERMPRGTLTGAVMDFVLPTADTVEKLSYGDPLMRQPPVGTGGRVPVFTGDREYLAEALGMAPGVVPALRGTGRAAARLSDAARVQLLRHHMRARNPVEGYDGY